MFHTATSRLLLLVLAVLCCAVTATSTVPFMVTNYNVFGIPTIVQQSGQVTRMHRIPTDVFVKILNQTDVISFCEAFMEDPRNDMLAELAKFGWKYSTPILSDPNPFTSLTNGGVIIVSKHPIVEHDQIIYRGACSGSDCLAAKGAVYAKVQKAATETTGAGTFNVFATHFQAWYDDKARAAREKQAAQLYSFAASKVKSKDEPVIFAGDFNVDMYKYPNDLQVLVKALNASKPVIVGIEQYSSDPRIDMLVGKDGGAKLFGCQKEYDDTGFCKCCPQEQLDYVLYSMEHKQPVATLSTPVHAKPTAEKHEESTAAAGSVNIFNVAVKVPSFNVQWSNFGARKNITDLSDHFPVYSRMQYEF